MTGIDAGLKDLTGNHAPEGTSDTVEVFQDWSYTLSASDFGFDDPSDSAANLFHSVIITALPTEGELLFDGEAVVVDQEILVADIEDGLLQYVPPEGEFGTALDSFSFKVKDDGGTLGSGDDTADSANTLTFDVLWWNHSPTGDDKTITLTSGSNYVFAAADFGFSDAADSDPNDLDSVIVVTLPESGQLLLDGTPVEEGDPVSAAELAAGDLVFVPTAGAFGSPLARFEFGLKDDGGEDDGGGSPYSLDSYVITFQRADGSGQAPVNNLPQAQATNEDSELILSTGSSNLLSITDTHVGANPIEVTLTAINGTITLSGTTGLTFSDGDGDDDETMTFEGTLASINAALDGLGFLPSADYHGDAAIEIFTSDLGNGGFGGTLTRRDRLAVTVDSVNDAPEGWDIARPVNEDEVYTFILPDFGFYDIEGNEFQAVKILSLPADGSLTLDGSAVSVNDVISIADIIDGKLTYTADSNDNGYGYASFTFKVQDDGGTANGGIDLDATTRTVTFDVIAQNDVPEITAPGSQSLNEDTTLVFSTGNGNAISISDIDAGSANVQCTLFSTEGVMTLSTTTGLSFSFSDGDGTGAGDGANDSEMCFRGTLSAINAALAGLTYTPDANYNGSALLSIAVNDLGNTGSGGAGQWKEILLNTIAPVNDAPTGANNTVNTSQNTDYVFGTSDFGFADAIDGNAFHALKITSLATNGTLYWYNGSAWVAVTLNQFISAADIAAGKLKYTPPSSTTGSFTFDFRVQDDGGTDNGGIDLDLTDRTMTVNVS